MTTTEAQGSTVTAASALADALARAGVKVAFTVPGEGVLGILEALSANRIRVVAARHEGSAAFMAEAVAQLTGRPAVCLATRGPGAANLAVGLHTARADSAAVVAIVGQIRREFLGREAFQEMDLVRTFEPIVKWAAEAHEAADVPSLVERAVAAATRGRPGPVLLSLPEDLLDAPAVRANGAQGSHAGSHPEQHAEPDPTLVRKVLHLLADSRRPLILAGAGVLRARSTDALVRFAEDVQIPVMAAWRRPDVFPNDHALFIGMTGLGSPASVRARLEEADALLVLGCRLNEMTTYHYEIPAEHTRWAHVDLEPRGAASGRRPPEVAMAADVAGFLRVARRVLARAAFDAASFDARREANAADREAYEAGSIVDAEPWDGPGVHPGRVVATLARVLPPEAIVTTDAGDFSTWAARGYRFRRPGTFLGPTSGAMGYGLPAAIAASLARPGRVAVALAGDGGFGMTMAELETAVRERAHVVAIVFDNGRYGTIWRHQQLRGGQPGLATELGPIDFAAYANACGALGLAVRSDDEFEPALREALEAGRPALLQLVLDPRWMTPDHGLRPEVVESAARGVSDVEIEEVTLGLIAAEAAVEAAEAELVREAAENAQAAAVEALAEADTEAEAVEAAIEETEAEALVEAATAVEADALATMIEATAAEAELEAALEREAELETALEVAAEPEAAAEDEAEAGAEPDAAPVEVVEGEPEPDAAAGRDDEAEAAADAVGAEAGSEPGAAIADPEATRAGDA